MPVAVNPSEVRRVCFRAECPNCGYNPKGQAFRVEEMGGELIITHNRCGFSEYLRDWSGEEVDWDSYVRGKISEGYVLWPNTGDLWAAWDLLPVEWEIINNAQAGGRKAASGKKKGLLRKIFGS